MRDGIEIIAEAAALKSKAPGNKAWTDFMNFKASGE